MCSAWGSARWSRPNCTQQHSQYVQAHRVFLSVNFSSNRHTQIFSINNCSWIRWTFFKIRRYWSIQEVDCLKVKKEKDKNYNLFNYKTLSFVLASGRSIVEECPTSLWCPPGTSARPPWWSCCRRACWRNNVGAAQLIVLILLLLLHLKNDSTRRERRQSKEAQGIPYLLYIYIYNAGVCVRI